MSEYLKHCQRVVRIERFGRAFKDCTDEIIYLQNEIERIKDGIRKLKERTFYASTNDHKPTNPDVQHGGGEVVWLEDVLKTIYMSSKPITNNGQQNKNTPPKGVCTKTDETGSVGSLTGIAEKASQERNPAHICMGPECNKYLGHRGFCSQECHDSHYDLNSIEEENHGCGKALPEIHPQAWCGYINLGGEQMFCKECSQSKQNTSELKA